MPKRSGYLDWEDFFIGICQLAAQRSKDPNTQVGCCLVNSNQQILGLGYNGLPRGCADDDFPWTRPEKYLYVCHAETNALLNVNNWTLVPGSRLYTTLFPCNECAKLIVQSGIRKVIYLDDKYFGTPENDASRKMFKSAGVEIKRFGSEPEKSVQVLSKQTIKSENTIDLTNCRMRRLSYFLRRTPVTISTVLIVYRFLKWYKFL